MKKGSWFWPAPFLLTIDWNYLDVVIYLNDYILHYNQRKKGWPVKANPFFLTTNLPTRCGLTYRSKHEHAL